MSSIVFTEVPATFVDPLVGDRWQWQATRRKIPRQAVFELQNMAEIVAQANEVLRRAHEDAGTIRQQAYAQGIEDAQGAISKAAAEALLRVQCDTKAYLDATEPRVVQLVFAVLRRLLPQLTPDLVLDSVVEEALRAVQGGHYLRVCVTPDVEPLAQSLTTQWRQRYPEIQHLEIVTDHSLAATECRVESPYGQVGVSLQDRFEKIVRAYEKTQADQQTRKGEP